MEIEQQNWSKTLLNSYSYLETICDAIDQTVLNYGLGSYSSNQTLLVTDKILSLIKRKKFLINTKVMVDKALNNISGASARILTVRYIDKVKTDIASQVLNMSNRNFFRRLTQAVEEFSVELKNQGFTSDVLFETYKAESWIIEIYNNYSKKSKQSEDSLNFLGLALSSLKSKNVTYSICR